MKLLLISSSLVHGCGYLEHPEPDIRRLLTGSKTVAFCPFAAHDHAAYTLKVRERFAQMGFEVVPFDDLDHADAVFVGGGNTFRLLKKLQERNLLDKLRRRALEGMPYIGSSAGSVISAPTIRTTNDMPIVECRSLDSLGLIPFQLNCHYLDPDPDSTHKGETREVRINEFHEENTTPVLGLREGSMLWVENSSVTLLGLKPARLFRRREPAAEVAAGTAFDSRAF
ncbi:MAG TPA: dipeptidase PepE [Thermoanaerobaculia bacterium]|nr:dipeptidase PepE [Thermoanaerobaculia bacterium]